MPLPVEVANKALGQLTSLTETAAHTMKRAPEDQLRLLNEIAQADLG
jgi:hypothetical protein